MISGDHRSDWAAQNFPSLLHQLCRRPGALRCRCDALAYLFAMREAAGKRAENPGDCDSGAVDGAARFCFRVIWSAIFLPSLPALCALAALGCHFCRFLVARVGNAAGLCAGVRFPRRFLSRKSAV